MARRRRRLKKWVYILLAVLAILVSTAFCAYALDRHLSQLVSGDGAQAEATLTVADGAKDASGAKTPEAKYAAGEEGTEDAATVVEIRLPVSGAALEHELAQGEGPGRELPQADTAITVSLPGDLSAESCFEALKGAAGSVWTWVKEALGTLWQVVAGFFTATDTPGADKGEPLLSEKLDHLDEELDAAIASGNTLLTMPGLFRILVGAVVFLILGVVLARCLAPRARSEDSYRSRAPATLTFDGCVLSKSQNTGVEFLYLFYADPTPDYSSLAPLLDTELKKKFTESEYASFMQTVKEKFGDMTEVRFIAFERLDAFDQLTYFASFTKEKMVVIRLGFSKRGKMVYFRLEPFNKQNKKGLAGKKDEPGAEAKA